MNHASADVVIGQPDFQSRSVNARADERVHDRGLHTPCGIWVDQGKLFIADQLNNRVLIYRQIPTQNFEPADIVVGQMDMYSNTASPSPNARTLLCPGGVLASGDQLYVADCLNNRVLVFRDATPPPTPTRTPVLSPTPTSTTALIPLPDGCAYPGVFMPGRGQKTEFVFKNQDARMDILIKIYNLRGQLVRTLANTREWDGRGDSGHLCEGGVYVYQIEAEGQRVSGKVVLVK
jgi:hypothetical protein